jgi:hypothetical protein
MAAMTHETGLMPTRSRHSVLGARGICLCDLGTVPQMLNGSSLPAWLTCLLIGSLAASIGLMSQPAVAAEPVTDQDRKLDCPGLRAAIADVTVQIKRAEAVIRKETANPPTSLVQMLQPAPPTATAKLAKTLLDTMAQSRLGGAVAKPPKSSVERCHVRGELSLQDCAEDVAKWRCRQDATKGRAYLVCIDQVAERVITASGYDVTTLAHYDPGCGDVAAPATCSVFVTNRTGSETKWCKRTSETTIEICEPPKPGTPSIATAAVAKPETKLGKPGKHAPTPVADKPAATALPPGSVCRPVPCQLGTSCDRLCGPPD